MKVGEGGLGGLSRRCSRDAVLAQKKICPTTKDTAVAFRAPEGFSPDPLTDLQRQGARRLIAQAVEAALNGFLAALADQTDTAGRRWLVRHGHLPGRDGQTGIGAVPVNVPRVRDRAAEGTPLRFTSVILPSCLRRAKSIEHLLPLLCLKGISTGVDAQTCRLIVLDCAVGSLTDFKKIIGRDAWAHEDTSAERAALWTSGPMKVPSCIRSFTHS